MWFLWLRFLSCVVMCCVVLCCVVLCCVVLLCYCVVLLCCAVLYCVIVLCCIVLLCCVVLCYCAVLYCIIVLCCIVLLCCAVLCCVKVLLCVIHTHPTSQSLSCDTLVLHSYFFLLLQFFLPSLKFTPLPPSLFSFPVFPPISCHPSFSHPLSPHSLVPQPIYLSSSLQAAETRILAGMAVCNLLACPESQTAAIHAGGRSKTPILLYWFCLTAVTYRLGRAILV